MGFFSVYLTHVMQLVLKHIMLTLQTKPAKAATRVVKIVLVSRIQIVFNAQHF